MTDLPLIIVDEPKSLRKDELVKAYEMLRRAYEAQEELKEHFDRYTARLQDELIEKEKYNRYLVQLAIYKDKPKRGCAIINIDANEEMVSSHSALGQSRSYVAHLAADFAHFLFSLPKELTDTIQELPVYDFQLSRAGWTSVHDELPDPEGDWVQVAAGGAINYMYFYDNSFSDPTLPNSPNIVTEEISHWLPCPAPPRLPDPEEVE